jgi:uncharacterized DUF497 family protein
VQGEYNLTTPGLRNATQHGISAAEIFEVIDSDTRLFSRAGDQSMLILGTTDAGRYVVILANDTDPEPDLWDVVAAREMREAEIAAYRKVQGGSDA